jgi:hypothetical protein
MGNTYRVSWTMSVGFDDLCHVSTAYTRLYPFMSRPDHELSNSSRHAQPLFDFHRVSLSEICGQIFYTLRDTRTRWAQPLACREACKAASVICDTCPRMIHGFPRFMTHPDMSYPYASRHAQLLHDSYRMSPRNITVRYFSSHRETRTR